MHAELFSSLVGDIMSRIQLFEGCGVAFLRKMCRMVRLYQFQDAQYISRVGDIGQEMYLIKKGEVGSFSFSLEIFYRP